MMLRSPLVGSALSVLAALAATLLAKEPERGGGSPRRIFPFAASESVLDNGLRVVVVPMDSPGIVQLRAQRRGFFAKCLR